MLGVFALTSKELVLAAIHNQETPRTPWVPFVGCHAAKLLNVNADEYFKSADLIVKGVTLAAQEYRADGVPALFDLQVEAEAMGCELQWAPHNPPSVSSHPLEDGKTIADLKVPTEKDGRYPVVLEATRRICETVGKDRAVYGLITGPFTLALHLMGTDIFYNMIDEPEMVHELLALCEKVGKEYSRMLIEAGVDIIAIVDPMTSQISPEAFAEFAGPYCDSISEHVHSLGKPVVLFVCGNAKNNIEEMCKVGVDGLSIDENIPLDYVRDVCRKYNKSFGGNIKLTLSMLFGKPADNVNDALQCLATGGKKGFILSPGCDMPFDVPVENAKAVASVVFGEVADVIESGNVLDGVEVKLPDYDDNSKVYIDVVTLDSDSCAPCQYMMSAVNTAVKGLENKVEVTEHKIKNKEGVAAMLKLGVSNIPTITIDGEVKFISIIPDNESLVKVIKEAMARKNV